MHWLSLSPSLFLYYSVSLSLHGFLHHLCGLVCLSISMSTDLLYLLSQLTPLSLSLPFFPALFFPFSVSLHLYSVLLSLSLSLFLSLYPSAYSATCLSFSNSPFIYLSSVWLSVSMSVSPFSSTGIKNPVIHQDWPLFTSFSSVTWDLLASSPVGELSIVFCTFSIQCYGL